VNKHHPDAVIEKLNSREHCAKCQRTE
jgi:hypothetical protein